MYYQAKQMLKKARQKKHGLKSWKAQDCTSLCPRTISSTCHVSFFGAPDTDHKHKFSLTHFIHFSYLYDNLTNTHKRFGSRSMFTVRSSRAEWRINTNPISYKRCKASQLECIVDTTTSAAAPVYTPSAPSKTVSWTVCLCSRAS